MSTGVTETTNQSMIVENAANASNEHHPVEEEL